jgi:photosynthetic reaction center cytochrome c subunit
MSALGAPFRLAASLLVGAFRGFYSHPWRWTLGVLTALIVVGIFSTLDGIPVASIQRGFRGVGMVQNYVPRIAAREIANHRLIPPQPPVTPSGTPSSQAYQNVQVLKNVDSNEFLRLMAAFPTWIAPATGCAFCHSVVNMADDTLYTKKIARHMIEMTRYINTNWKSHVGETGVTCNTCHRGHAVPEDVWFSAAPGPSRGVAENNTGFTGPSREGALTSLPSDPFTPYLLDAQAIRVTGLTALPAGNRASIKQTDLTYSLMAHFGQSLGVNCTYCHNSRDFGSWDQGTPQRVTAWYGIKMVRDLNNQFMVPLTGTFPRASLGPTGDVAKIDCGTCHQGAYKPLFGASDLIAYPELTGASVGRQASVAAPTGAKP